MRSYAIHRPIGPFTWPSEHRDKVLELVNFDSLKFVPEIGRNAFGYIDWADGVPMEDLNRYELVVPKQQDALLRKIGRALAAQYEKSCETGLEAEEERLSHMWEIARDKYGYTDDQIGDAMCKFLD